MKCNKCNKPIEATDLFCPYCGTKNQSTLNENKKVEEKENINVRKSKKKIIIFSIIILLLIIISIGIYFYLKNKDRFNSVQNNVDVETTENQREELEPVTEDSDKSEYGKRFTFTVQELENKYKDVLKNNYNDYEDLLKSKLIDEHFTPVEEDDGFSCELNQKCYDKQNNIKDY